jgi:hypothetical protein
MSLPAFNEFGDLPPGVYQRTLSELLTRFGTGSPQRVAVTARLQRIHELASSTGKLIDWSCSGAMLPISLSRTMSMWYW